MAVTILEALQNADYNLQNNVRVLGMAVVSLAAEQVHNATGLLEKGYELDDEIEPLLEKHGSLDAVPYKY